MHRAAACLIAAVLLCGCNRDAPPLEGEYTLTLEDATGRDLYQATLEVWDLSGEAEEAIEAALTDNQGLSAEDARRLLRNFRGVALARPTTISPERLVTQLLVLDGPFLLSGADLRFVGSDITRPRDDQNALSLLMEQDGEDIETAALGLFRRLLLGILPDAVTEFLLRELGVGSESLIRLDGVYVPVKGRAEPTGFELRPFPESILGLF